jgi:hypothetical protein
MGRTTRAYDLVCSYARHCPGGSRWSSDRIAEIREQGQHLHEEVRDLRYWQRRAAQDEHLGEDTMNKIHVTAERVREMCEQVQACIMGYERVPEGQRLTPSLAREDWPSQAEAGNGEGDGRGKAIQSPIEKVSADPPRARSHSHSHSRSPSPSRARNRARKLLRSPSTRQQEVRQCHVRREYRDGDSYRPDHLY